MQSTPLYPIYQKYQAKVVDFHGWALPVQFESIIQEHLAVRQQVGIFDVSHMGEIWINGPEALAYLDHLLTNRISGLKPGFIRYSPLCYPNGGTIDDLLVYRLAETEFLLVVNASNTERDFQWLQSQAATFDLQLENRSAATAQLAVQGPLALQLLQKLTPYPLGQLKYYQFAPEISLANQPVLISRTGYTGEDGFEIYTDPAVAIALWEQIMATGHDLGIVPVGLGARDTLRLEAGLPLYGHELSESITPLEAGLDRFVKLDKPEFIGRAALLAQQQQGVGRRLAGIVMLDRGIPRSDYRIFHQQRPIGVVTSGSYAPALAQNLAMVLIEAGLNPPDRQVQIEIREKLLAAELVTLPFYTRKKGASS